jgi:hypothetical protein
LLRITCRYKIFIALVIEYIFACIGIPDADAYMSGKQGGIIQYNIMCGTTYLPVWTTGNQRKQKKTSNKRTQSGHVPNVLIQSVYFSA